MSTDPLPPSGFDPLDSASGIPYEGYAELRRHAPVSRTPNGTVFLAKQDDVMNAAKAIDLFRATFREPGVIVPDDEMLISEIPEPRHGQMRRIVNSAIAAHRISDIGPFVSQLAHGLIDKLIVDRHGELVNDLVMPIPTSAIAQLLGAPPEDSEKWAKWSDEVVQGDYPRLNRTERGEGLGGGHPEFAGYIDQLISDHRSADSPPTDFITRLLGTEVDGMRLNDLELRTLLAFLLMAGNETTRNMLANLLHSLATLPSLFADLRREPSLGHDVVEESLRFDPPVLVLMRECIEDTTVRGMPIRKGESVAFGIASGNRDEQYYEAPDEFRLGRPQSKAHITFGNGPHVCPGASLARLEGRVLLDVLLEKVERIELEAGYRRQKVPVFWANGPQSLPASLIPRDSS
ncbi:MAG: cytochrome P450 [Myxococcota bacterium]